MKLTFTRLHLILLGFVLFNVLLEYLVGIRFSHRLTSLFVFVIYFSGFILFFWNLKPLKGAVVYFSLYFITPLVTALFFLFGGIPLASVSSILWYPVYPDEVAAKSENAIVYRKSHGVMAPCCAYDVRKVKYVFLEKHLSTVEADDDITIRESGEKHTLIVSWPIYDYFSDIETDTTITISLK